MKITKSVGTTRTEKLLSRLCNDSFLELWSYPNPFNSKKKELCDLLAVFENHVFIFFDRENLQLDNRNKDPEINWKRWKRKSSSLCCDDSGKYIVAKALFHKSQQCR